MMRRAQWFFISLPILVRMDCPVGVYRGWLVERRCVMRVAVRALSLCE